MGKGQQIIMLIENQWYTALSSEKFLTLINISFKKDNAVEEISLAELINNNPLNRRSIFIVEQVESLAHSSLNRFTQENQTHDSRMLKDVHSVEITSKILGIDLSIFTKNDIELKIVTFINKPLLEKNIAPDHPKFKLLGMSDIFFIYLIFCKTPKPIGTPNQNHYIYESYNEYGFLATDLHFFQDYVRKKIGVGTHDLIEQFTTTELANEMMAEGVMALCWGLTPWVYMIGLESNEDHLLQFPMPTKKSQHGFYRIKSDFKNLSIIPGVSLLSWDTESKSVWPYFFIEGSKNTLEIKITTIPAKNPHTTDITPIPFATLRFTHKNSEKISPILSFDLFSKVF